jgi:hypothetical protein
LFWWFWWFWHPLSFPLISISFANFDDGFGGFGCSCLFWWFWWVLVGSPWGTPYFPFDFYQIWWFLVVLIVFACFGGFGGFGTPYHFL